jgi:ankyrin repeat protein
MIRSVVCLLLILYVFCAVMLAADSAELLTAIRNGNHAAVEKLIRSGVDVNTVDSDGTTALMHAVIESDVKMMKLLIDHGANVNAKNAAESTALLYAVTNLSKARVLLDAGADVKVKNKRNSTTMSVAVTAFGSTPVLKLLAAKGAEPQDSLMNAVAQKGDLEAIQFLLSMGVSPGADSGPVSAAAGARCDECVRLLIAKGATVAGVRGNGQGVLSQSVKRALLDTSQLALDHGASLDVKDREGFTLLMQSLLSMEPPEKRDAMVKWLLSKGVDPNVKNDRGQTAYQLASRMGAASTMKILADAGATTIEDQPWPKSAGAADARTAVARVLPLLETSGEAVFKNRSCISCHNNSLPAMTIALARKKGFTINEEQAKKELGFAIATEQPFFEAMRMGTSIGGGADTVGYTLMGMAAAGYPADALTDSHIQYLSIYQYPDGAWRTTSYRPPAEYSPFASTAVVLRAMRLYPIPGRHEEFEERFARAKKWLLSTKAYSGEEHCMQLNGLAAAGATAAERAPFVKALKAGQNADGSWSQLPGIPGDAYATGEALYALHISADVPVSDPAYQKGVKWILRNQLADGTWFVPARTVPIQPFFASGFPHGSTQWSSDAGSSWASMALLFTLPDKTAGN